MRRILAVLLLLLLLAPRPGGAGEGPPKLPSTLRAGERKEIEELLRSFFRARDEATRKRALEGLRARDPVPPKAVKDLAGLCLALAREGPRSERGAVRQLQSGGTRGKYLVVGAGGGGRKGIFIGLHGGGPGAGNAETAMAKWSSAAGKGCIAVFPQATRLVHDAWNQLDQERFVLEIIEELKRTHRIDTNRIYLAGHSMGGYGTWSIGGHHADLFAAISPNSGGVYGTKSIEVDISDRGGPGLRLDPGVIPNLYLLPTRWFHGTDDRQCPIENDLEAERQLLELKKRHPEGYEFHFEKIDGIGHGIAPGGLSPIISWMTRRRRNPYPRKVIWEPDRSYKRHFYWLHLPRVSRGVLIVAEIVKRREIEIRTSGGFVPRLTLFLSDELVDARKEVTVVWNGKERFRGYLTPSVAALAENVRVRRDPAMILTYRIDLE